MVYFPHVAVLYLDLLGFASHPQRKWVVNAKSTPTPTPGLPRNEWKSFICFVIVYTCLGRERNKYPFVYTVLASEEESIAWVFLAGLLYPEATVDIGM